VVKLYRERGAAVDAKESFAATAARVSDSLSIQGLSAVAKLLRRSAAKTKQISQGEQQGLSARAYVYIIPVTKELDEWFVLFSVGHRQR
jgi:hypothetical protein